MDTKERIDGLSEAQTKAALLHLCIKVGVGAYTFAEQRKGTEEDYKIAVLNGALRRYGNEQVKGTDLKERIDGLSDAQAKAALWHLCMEEGVADHAFASRRKGTIEDYEIAVLNGALKEVRK